MGFRRVIIGGHTSHLQSDGVFAVNVRNDIEHFTDTSGAYWWDCAI